MKLNLPDSHVSIHLTNLKPGDTAFFDALTKLFCDPQYEAALNRFRRGETYIHFNPSTHELSLLKMAPGKLCNSSQLSLN